MRPKTSGPRPASDICRTCAPAADENPCHGEQPAADLCRIHHPTFGARASLRSVCSRAVAAGSSGSASWCVTGGRLFCAVEGTLPRRMNMVMRQSITVRGITGLAVSVAARWRHVVFSMRFHLLRRRRDLRG